ncbi:MAG: carboxypeptidase regulatory-like domain-containing protein [Bacillota bacterium]
MSLRKISLLLFAFILFFVLVGCESGLMDEVETKGKIKGILTNGQEALSGVTVTIVELEKSTITDNDGTYSFTDIDSGEYTLTFKSENIDLTREAVVNGDIETVNIDISGMLATVEDCQEFVGDLNNSGMHMTENLSVQMQEFAQYVEEETVPYMERMASRLNMIAIVESIWTDYNSEFRLVDDKNINYGLIEPGKYVLRNGVLEQEEKYDYADSELWVWDFVLENAYGNNDIYDASISMTNYNDLYRKDSDGLYSVVDYSKGEFHYSQSLREDPEDFSMEIDFTASSSSTQILADFDSYENHTTEIIAPDIGNMTLDGKMVDKTVIMTSEGDELTPINEVTINGNVDYDLDTESDDNNIVYNGSFKSDVIESNGKVIIEMDSFPSYDSVDLFPMLSKVEVEGSLKAGKAYFENGFKVSFTENSYEPYFEGPVVPNSIEIYGAYRYTNSPDDITNLMGNFLFDIDYSSFTTADGFEYEDNYFIYDLSFEGGYSQTGFYPLDLNIDINRNEYDKVDTSLIYSFGSDKKINVSIAVDESNFEINAFTDKIDLAVEFDIEEDYVGEIKIGSITNMNNEELAKIFLIDGQPQVLYNDSSAGSIMF